MEVLLAAHPTVGHTQALRAVGVELRRRGHGVRFATSHVPTLPSILPAPQALRAATEVMRSLVRDGFEVIRTPFSLEATIAAARIAHTRGYDELGWATRLFTANIAACTRLLREALRRATVRVVVHDFTFFGAWLAAEAAGIPSVAVFHSGLPFPVPGRPPFGSGLAPSANGWDKAQAQARLDAIEATMERRLGRVRRSLGLGPAAPRLMTRPYSRSLNVITSFEALELPRPGLAAAAMGPILWAGPCLAGRSEADEQASWAPPPCDRPSVYVSLGTVFNDQPAIYRALLDGVHEAGARAIVAAGASLEAIRPLSRADDVVERSLPQLAVLRQVEAVIGHGGNNSTNETLCAGKPLLVVPFGAEQIANAQRVEALGVGAMLRPEDLSRDAVRQHVIALLAGEMGARAQALKARLPTEDGTATVASAVEALGAQSALA